MSWDAPAAEPCACCYRCSHCQAQLRKTAGSAGFVGQGPNMPRSGHFSGTGGQGQQHSSHRVGRSSPGGCCSCQTARSGAGDYAQKIVTVRRKYLRRPLPSGVAMQWQQQQHSHQQQQQPYLQHRRPSGFSETHFLKFPQNTYCQKIVRDIDISNSTNTLR